MVQPAMRIAAEDSKPITRRLNLTVAAIKGIPQPAHGKQAWVYDLKVPGLCLLTTANGVQTFYLYRKVKGRPQRVRIGGFPEITIDQARNLAAQLNGKIAAGADPQAEKRAIRDDSTLGEVWERWLKDKKERLRGRTIETDESRWKTCFKDDWSNRKLNAIKPADVQRKLNSLGESKGHTTANRAIQLLRRLMTFAKVDPNPCAKGNVDFFREQKRERYLTGDEMVKLLAAIDSEPNSTIADFTKLCLWTGQRRGNVASMRWDELDLDKATWTIPATKFKTHKPLTVPLVPQAMEVLTKRIGNKSDFVFPGHGDAGHLVEPKEGWKRILKRAGLSNVHLHDLRHNVASWAVQHGASLPAIGAMLGHANPATTARYAHLAADPIRATAELAAKAMQTGMEAAKARAEAEEKKQAGQDGKDKGDK